MRKLAESGIKREVIAKLKEGDQSVYRAIYDCYVNRLYFFTLKFVRSHELAEELVQSVFVKLWESRSQINLDLSFEAYLYKITKNHTLNFLKRAAYERQFRDNLKKNYSFSSNDTKEQVDLNETLSIINQAIDLLPPKRQRIFRLSRIDGVEHDRIAAQLGISKNTVKVQLVKATKFIKSHYYKATDVAVVFLVLISL